MGPISKHDTPCTGGADDYLKLLLDEIMPEAEALLPGAPPGGASPVTRWLGCSPSTLSTKRMCLPAQRVCQVPSGLRASWNMCAPHEMKRKPDCLYFSLGDKESSTDNPILNVVQQNTRR